MIMAVMARETWTDERLDDLNKKVDKGFADTGKRFDRLETRMDKQFAELNQRFDRMLIALLGSAGAIVAALIATQF